MGVLDAIKSVNLSAAVRGYSHTAELQSRTLGYEDRQLALHGFPYTCPDVLPEGFNSIAANNSPIDENNGLLHIHGKYDADGNAPVRTFLAVG